MSNNRADRVGGEIQKCISDIIRDDIKDPRLPEIISIVSVNISKDLKHAKVNFSVFENGDITQKVLNKASGFIKHRLNEQLKLRNVPELRFKLDDSIKYSIDIAQKLRSIEDHE
jgi:ribosome-binding factor A